MNGFAAGGLQPATSDAVNVGKALPLPDLGGVRIEDLVVVTDDGCDLLNHTPKPLITL